MYLKRFLYINCLQVSALPNPFSGQKVMKKGSVNPKHAASLNIKTFLRIYDFYLTHFSN